MTRLLESGTRLGRFLLERELGRGGMYVAFLARDTVRGHSVALNLLADELAGNREFLARFEREVRRAATLSHPGIVRVLDVGQEDAAHFVVMEFIRGRSLSAQLQEQGALPSLQVVSIARQLGDALDYAHADGILHRDVEPSNVLLDPSGRAALTDFGLASAVQDSLPADTGVFLANPLYTSPEQAAGLPLDHRADLYSLAVLLYEALAGRPPFSDPFPQAVLIQHMTAPAPRITSVKPDLPAEADSVFSKALAKVPDDRFASGAELAEALERALARPVTVRGQSTSTPGTNRRLLLSSLPAGALILALGLMAATWMTDGRGGAMPTATAPDTPTGVPVAHGEPSPGPVRAAPPPAVVTAPTATRVPATPTPPQPTATPTEPQDVDAALAHIDAPWSAGEWDTVVSRLAPLQARYPDNPALRDKLYTAYVEQGRALEIAEHPVEARRPYTAAVQVDPSRPEAAERLEAIDSIGKALAWRIYRWKPGPAFDHEELRAYQDGDAYALQAKTLLAARSAWSSTAVQIGTDFVVRVSARLPSQPGGLDVTLWESPDRPQYSLRIWRGADGALGTALLHWRPGGSPVDVLAARGPADPIVLDGGQPDLLRLEGHVGMLTAAVNGNEVWAGQPGRPVSYVSLGAYAISQPDATVSILEYVVYEP